IADVHMDKSPTAEQWKKIGIRHHHGFCIALFSIKTATSGGIGEYPDLLPLIDWCANIGFDIIQLLPLNDTGPDPSPYSAISAFALNPLHLGLAQLPNIDHYPVLQQILQQLQALNNAQRVDYPMVRELKERFLQQYYAWEFPNFAHNDDYQ